MIKLKIHVLRLFTIAFLDEYYNIIAEIAFNIRFFALMRVGI